MRLKYPPCLIDAMRLLAAFALALTALVAPAFAQATSCSIAFIDPIGDVVLYKQVPGMQDPRPSVDLRGVNLTLRDGALHYSVEVGARPGAGELGYNRYWLGFHVDGGHGPEYVDVRIAATSTYDEGWLVGPTRLGLLAWGTVPIAWNGTEMSFRLPIEPLQAHFEQPLHVGQPQASADGPSMTKEVQGSIAGAVLMDFAPDGVQDFQALAPCPSPPPSPVPAEAPRDAASMPLALVGLTLLALARHRARSRAP